MIPSEPVGLIFEWDPAKTRDAHGIRFLTRHPREVCETVQGGHQRRRACSRCRAVVSRFEVGESGAPGPDPHRFAAAPQGIRLIVVPAGRYFTFLNVPFLSSMNSRFGRSAGSRGSRPNHSIPPSGRRKTSGRGPKVKSGRIPRKCPSNAAWRSGPMAHRRHRVCYGFDDPRTIVRWRMRSGVA
jgi:hypothetical protein